MVLFWVAEDLGGTSGGVVPRRMDQLRHTLLLRLCSGGLLVLHVLGASSTVCGSSD